MNCCLVMCLPGMFKVLKSYFASRLLTFNFSVPVCYNYVEVSQLFRTLYISVQCFNVGMDVGYAMQYHWTRIF